MWVVQTLTLPTVASGTSAACTLFVNTGDPSGSLIRSRSGAVLTLLCWGVSPQVGAGSGSFLASTTTPRVVARIFPDGSVSTTEWVTDAYTTTIGGQQLYSAALDDNLPTPRYWMTGNPLTGGSGGTRTFLAGSRTSSNVNNGGTLRTM